MAKRIDLRQLDVCSVDPIGCKDIDDALHCIVLPNGNWEVGVHIADVSYFVYFILNWNLHFRNSHLHVFCV